MADNIYKVIELPLYIEIFTISIVLCLLINFFMHSYLLRRKAIDRSILARYMGSEIIFRFRDFTRKNNSYLHILYYIELWFVAISVVMSIPFILREIDFNNKLTLFVLPSLFIIIILIMVIVFQQSKDKYY